MLGKNKNSAYADDGREKVSTLIGKETTFDGDLTSAETEGVRCRRQQHRRVCLQTPRRNKVQELSAVRQVRTAMGAVMDPLDLWQFFDFYKKIFTKQLSDNIMNLHNILKITKVL